jgi:hypothetical protein
MSRRDPLFQRADADVDDPRKMWLMAGRRNT